MKQKILIVDDNVVIEKLYQSALRNDYELKTCISPQEALNYLQEEKPDLIILDILMPVMDGYTLCSEIKSNKETADIPIIFSSTKSAPKDRITGYEYGAINYIEKPFEISELRSIIRSTLQHFNKNNENINYKNINLNLLTQKVFSNDMEIVFTKSEYLIFLQFLKRPEQVFSRNQILETLSPENFDISDRSIDSHISSIRKKIRETDIELKTKYGQGYYLV